MEILTSKADCFTQWRICNLNIRWNQKYYDKIRRYRRYAKKMQRKYNQLLLNIMHTNKLNDNFDMISIQGNKKVKNFLVLISGQQDIFGIAVE